LFQELASDIAVSVNNHGGKSSSPRKPSPAKYQPFDESENTVVDHL